MLEVLVTLMITAVASTIILVHLRTLIDFDTRVRRYQGEITGLINEAVRLQLPDWGLAATRSLREDHVAITLEDRVTPSVFITNFHLNEDSVASVDQVYTPYQVYRVQPGARYSLSLLFPNLPPEY